MSRPCPAGRAAIRAAGQQMVAPEMGRGPRLAIRIETIAARTDGDRVPAGQRQHVGHRRLRQPAANARRRRPGRPRHCAGDSRSSTAVDYGHRIGFEVRVVPPHGSTATHRDRSAPPAETRTAPTRPVPGRGKRRSDVGIDQRRGSRQRRATCPEDASSCQTACPPGEPTSTDRRRERTQADAGSAGPAAPTPSRDHDQRTRPCRGRRRSAADGVASLSDDGPLGTTA